MEAHIFKKLKNKTTELVLLKDVLVFLSPGI